VVNCPIGGIGKGLAPRTVYVTGDVDTWFSLPAAMAHKGKRVTGALYCDEDNGGWHFHPDHSEANKIKA